MKAENKQIAVAHPGAPQNRSAMMALAERCNVDPGKLTSALKETVFKGAKDSELLALVVVANEYRLNPFLREIYAFPNKGGGIVPVVGIDGWLRIINEHPQLDGMDVAVSDDGSHATCKIYRKDRTRPTIVTEFLDECRRNTDPWKQSPKRMLRHKVIIQCARIAFGFSGIYDEDDGALMRQERNVTPAKFAPQPSPASFLDVSAEPEQDAETEDHPASVRLRLESGGHTEPQYLAALHSFGLIDDGAEFDDVPDKVHVDALQDWETVKAAMEDADQ